VETCGADNAPIRIQIEIEIQCHWGDNATFAAGRKIRLWWLNNGNKGSMFSIYNKDAIKADQYQLVISMW